MEIRIRSGRRLPRAAIGAFLVALVLSGLAAVPALGSAWTVRQLPGEASKVMLFGISCPSTSLCVAVGGNNTVASSTNPAGGAESWEVVFPGEGLAGVGGAGFFNGRQIRGVSCPGLRGPQGSWRFRVCHPTYPPQCQGKPVSSRP